MLGQMASSSLMQVGHGALCCLGAQKSVEQTSQKMLSNIILFRIQEGNLRVPLLCDEVVVTLVGDLGPEHTHKKTPGGSLIDCEPLQIQAPSFLTQRQCPRGIIQKALRKQEGRESASGLEAGRPMIWA